MRPFSRSKRVGLTTWMWWASTWREIARSRPKAWCWRDAGGIRRPPEHAGLINLADRGGQTEVARPRRPGQGDPVPGHALRAGSISTHRPLPNSPDAFGRHDLDRLQVALAQDANGDALVDAAAIEDAGDVVDARHHILVERHDHVAGLEATRLCRAA